MNRIRSGSIVGILCAASAALAAPIRSAAVDATCTGGAQLITIPEGQAEAGFTLSCPGFVLPPSVDGTVAVFLDATGAVSDFVTFANISGSATFVFVSDTEGQLVIPPVGVPVLTTVTEPSPVVVIATSTSGAGQLRFSFTSDSNESSSASETIGIEAIPEPGSFTLIGLGSLVLLCREFARRRTAKNLVRN